MIDQESAINSVTDRIINNTFALKPISSILLQGSVVDEKRMIYRGVDVFVVPDIPPEIGVKYTCTYIDPVDELVLSALGLVLLNSYFPNLVQEKMIKEFFNDIESNENVKELIVFYFERGCSSSKTNSSLNSIVPWILPHYLSNFKNSPSLPCARSFPWAFFLL